MDKLASCRKKFKNSEITLQRIAFHVQIAEQVV